MIRRLFARRATAQGLVEFALVFPLIVLFLFGVFDLGRAVYAYSTLTNAVRQGARVAAVNQVVTTNTTCAEDQPVEDPGDPHWSIKACTVSAGTALGLRAADVTVSYASPPGSTLSCSPTLHVGCIASVSASYSWSAITPVIGNLVGPVSMTATSEIPIERVFP